MRRARTRPATCWAATYLLMGLVYPGELLKTFFKEFVDMKESTTYQAILREGKARREGRGSERKSCVRLGEKRFGPMSPGSRRGSRRSAISTGSRS